MSIIQELELPKPLSFALALDYADPFLGDNKLSKIPWNLGNFELNRLYTPYCKFQSKTQSCLVLLYEKELTMVEFLDEKVGDLKVSID